MATFGARMLEAGVTDVLQRLGLATTRAERTATVKDLAKFCAPYVAKLAKIRAAPPMPSAFRLNDAARRLRNAQKAIATARTLSTPPWLEVPASHQLPPRDARPSRVLVAGSVEQALEDWADFLDSAAALSRDEEGVTRREREKLRKLHSAFRFAFFRMAFRSFDGPCHALGAALFNVTFGEAVTEDAYRKAVARDRDSSPAMFEYASRPKKKPVPEEP